MKKFKSILVLGDISVEINGLKDVFSPFCEQSTYVTKIEEFLLLAGEFEVGFIYSRFFRVKNEVFIEDLLTKLKRIVIVSPVKLIQYEKDFFSNYPIDSVLLTPTTQDKIKQILMHGMLFDLTGFLVDGLLIEEILSMAISSLETIKSKSVELIDIVDDLDVQVIVEHVHSIHNWLIYCGLINYRVKINELELLFKEANEQGKFVDLFLNEELISLLKDINKVLPVIEVELNKGNLSA